MKTTTQKGFKTSVLIIISVLFSVIMVFAFSPLRLIGISEFLDDLKKKGITATETTDYNYPIALPAESWGRNTTRFMELAEKYKITDVNYCMVGSNSGEVWFVVDMDYVGKWLVTVSVGWS